MVEDKVFGLPMGKKAFIIHLNLRIHLVKFFEANFCQNVLNAIPYHNVIPVKSMLNINSIQFQVAKEL